MAAIKNVHLKSLDRIFELTKITANHKQDGRPKIKDMLFLFLFGGSVSICFYAIIKQKIKTNLVVAVPVIALLGISTFGLGMGFEKYRYHEYYIFRFSQFSQHIATLAEQQRISELTNSVILFNQKFAAGTDPKALEDVVFEILKVGKYYSESETNTQEFHK